jgi:hypothetical protein
MEFVTIHDLSRELNIPARVVRYRLINLIADSKFRENEDFRRDDYKDDQHFVWKINPLRFMHETGLKPTAPLPTDNIDGNHPLPPVNGGVNNRNANGNEPPVTVTKSGNSVDTKPEDSSIAREMIDILKDQIRVKDSQLRDQSEQLKQTHDLNVKLTGTMLQQAKEIKNLLQLTGGKTEMAEFVTRDAAADNNGVNEKPRVDNQSRSDGNQSRNDVDSARSA